jgi:hypothetical protein
MFDSAGDADPIEDFAIHSVEECSNEVPIGRATRR